MADLARGSAQPVHPVTEAPSFLHSSEVVEAPIWKSVRFRLTGWYALLVFCLILGLSIALHTLLVSTLANDAEERLRAAAAEIADNVTLTRVDEIGPYTTDTGSMQVEVEAPDEAAMLLSGLWFQLYNMNRQPLASQDGRTISQIPSALSEVLIEPEEYWTDRPVLTTISLSGVESMVLFTPLYLKVDGQAVQQDSPPFWVVVGEPLGSRAKLVDITDQSLFLFGTSGALLAVWIGWIMAGRALTPVTRLMESARAIAQADGNVSLSRRVMVPTTGDELSQLAMTFNSMLDRIERAFVTQQRFVADASHELRTPLTAVRGTVDVMLREIDAGRELQEEIVAEDLLVVKRESSRMSRLIEDMLMLARTDGASLSDILKPAEVRLDELAANAYQVVTQLPGGDAVHLDADLPVQVYGDSDRLVQVMIILLDNAMRHTPAGGSITLSIDTARDPESGQTCARIRVADTGEGIPPDHVPHLFDRFYRVEVARSRASGGTGLGLSIALALVRGHHGWIDVETKVGEGTTFTVWLPVEDGLSRDSDLDARPRSSWVPSPLIPRPIRIRRQGSPKHARLADRIEGKQHGDHDAS